MVGWLAYLLLTGTCVVASVTDVRHGKVLNQMTYPAALAGLVFWALAGAWGAGPALGETGLAGVGAGLAAAFTGLVLGFVPAAALSFLGLGLGMGDAKLVGVVGAWLASWQALMATSFYALLGALLMAVVLMLYRRVLGATLKSMLFSAVAIAGRQKGSVPSSGVLVPFALPITLGVALAGAEHFLGLVTPWAAAGPKLGFP